MSEAADLAERRRLRRRLTLWRGLAIAAAVIAVAAIAVRAVPTPTHVARISVTGPIFDDPARSRLLRRIAGDDSVRALIVRIDSPGGTVAGSEALYEALRSVAEAKPVVAVMGEAAASGGYIAALAADHVVARGGTITGSIGVIAELPNVEDLLDAIGVEFNRVASGPLKAEPSPFRAPSPAAIAAEEAVVADAYAWFLDLVAERRSLDPARARELGDGRVYTGRQALAAGLIDAIGGEPEARAWLATERDVAETLPARDRDARPPEARLLDLVLEGAVRARSAAETPRLWAVAR